MSTKKSPTLQETKEPKSEGYYLYNPLKGTEHNATFNDFNTACNTARSLRGTWEVHAISRRKRK